MKSYFVIGAFGKSRSNGEVTVLGSAESFWGASNPLVTSFQHGTSAHTGTVNIIL